MNITITKKENPGKLPETDELGFGKYFTDHMFLMDYSDTDGWHNARIVPFGPVSMSPAAGVLHYGAEVFEGLKAYRRPDGGVQLFRPWENMARLNRSCDRIGLPRINEEDGLQAIRGNCVDERWVPSEPGTSLYPSVPVFHRSDTLSARRLFGDVCRHSLPFRELLQNGLKPVPIMVETEDVHAVRGGTGERNAVGTTPLPTAPADKAAEKGYAQVLWLDGVERKYVERGRRYECDVQKSTVPL